MFEIINHKLDKMKKLLLSILTLIFANWTYAQDDDKLIVYNFYKVHFL